jgi:hypothetical protein
MLIPYDESLCCDIFAFCDTKKSADEIKLKFVALGGTKVLQHLFFMRGMDILYGDIFGFSYQQRMPKDELTKFQKRIILDAYGHIMYIRDNTFVDNIRQPNLNITLPNPNDIDLIRFALSTILKPFPTGDIVTKCELDKSEVSNFKAMRRAVSLEKALEISAKMNESEMFVELMHKLMLKKMQMMGI